MATDENPPQPFQARPPRDWTSLLALIRSEFAFMDGRIDPPSSMHRLTEAEIARQAEQGEIWVVGDPPIACIFLTQKPGVLYLGKLAVSSAHRGRGLARCLINLAAHRARALDLRELELQVRVELVENQRAFAALGFAETGRSAHPGYARPTTITMRRPV